MTLEDLLVNNKIVVADGAMGTMLMAAGIPPGDTPEALNLSHPEILENIAAAYLAAGSRIIQTNTFGASTIRLAEYGLADRTEEINAAAVKAVRKAVGDEMDIMVDANYGWAIAPDRAPQRWDLRTAISMARAMEEMGVYWLEEPLPCYDYDGLAELRRQVNLRIAGGELNQGLHEFRIFLEKDCFDVYQPDVTFAGGLLQCRQIAGMVHAHGKIITPHTWTNGIGFAANLHFAASLERCPYIEFPYDPPNWTPEARDFVLTEPFRIDAEGYVQVPQKPGLGIELDEEKLAKLKAADPSRLV